MLSTKRYSYSYAYSYSSSMFGSHGVTNLVDEYECRVADYEYDSKKEENSYPYSDSHSYTSYGAIGCTADIR